MPTEPYDEILKRAETELTQEQQQKLSEVLSQYAGRKNGGKHRVTDLRGLGKEIWEGIDADEYVAKERDSWDG
ncbi:MAG: hypothetical protein MI757_03535 [Pirellulales bacterium]|nr:hypothetical protein [Pirellulales bacterium]